jgi:hypothetical protein
MTERNLITAFLASGNPKVRSDKKCIETPPGISRHKVQRLPIWESSVPSDACRKKMAVPITREDKIPA